MAAAAPTPAPAGLARLRQEFGQGLAEDVLVSVLEMFQGNVQETINFLRAGQGDYIDDPNAAKTPKLPTDYFTPPAGWSASLVAQHARPRTPAVSMKEFFLRDTTTFQEHFNFLAPESTQRSLYTAVLSLLLRSGVELNHGIKVRALTAALGTKNNQLVDLLLGFNLMFDLPVIVACLRFLDLPRRVVAWEKKLVRLERQGSAKSTTIVQIRGRLTEVRNLMMPDQKTSVNGAMCRRFRKWAKTLPKATLEFVALSLPKELWAEFADFVHPSPNCFALDYFLPVCFGVPPAADTMVAACSNLNANNVEQLIRSYDIPYSHIRRNCPQLTPLIKERVATYEKFSTVLWWYEELASPAVDLIIEARLDRGDELDLPYGKLMERLLFFKMNGVRFYAKLIPIAEKRIRSISLVLDRPVMVIGDASFSMDVAIRTSTIIASLLCALAHADLRFFNDKVLNPNLLPTSAEDVIEVASTTKADGLTAPAVALADLFAERRVVKYFVVVTDEIENEAHDGEFFAQLFYKYYTTVYPARIVMVSFLEDPGSSAKGRMVSALEQLGIPPLQFRLDGSRPDLTKIDSLLGLLSSESDFFSQQAAEIASQLDTGAPLDAVLEKARDQVDFQVGPHAETDESGASTSSSSSSSVPAPFRPELEEE